MKRSGRVVKAHTRGYDDPLRVRKGAVVRITKRELWDDRHPWVWGIADDGREGWIPEEFVEQFDERATLLRDYNAIELTVALGDNLIIIDEANGWYWAQNRRRETGWVPVACVALDLL